MYPVAPLLATSSPERPVATLPSTQGLTTPAVSSSSLKNASNFNSNTSIMQNGITITSRPPAVEPTVGDVKINLLKQDMSSLSDSAAEVGEPGAFLRSLQNYLVNSPLLHNNSGDNDNVVSDIENINKSMSSVAAAVTNNNSANVLSQQQGMQSIIDQEMDRLKQKKQNIEGAMTTQKRMMILNDSFLKRQQMFSKIAIAVVIGVSLIFCFRYFSINNPDLEGLANVMSIFVIVTVFIYCMWIYVAILRRDPIYFDQLYYIPDKVTPSPVTISDGGYSAPNASGKAQLLNRSTTYDGECVGPNCCSLDNGTVWDSSANACVSNTTNVGSNA